MEVKESYLICDRCKNQINARWYRLVDITKFKKRLVLSGYVHDGNFDLCGTCTEKFERFMDNKLDDDIPTEEEIYHLDKKKTKEGKQ